MVGCHCRHKPHFPASCSLINSKSGLSATWPKVNAAETMSFNDLMVVKKTRERIGIFCIGRYGFPLFFPDSGKKLKPRGCTGYPLYPL